MSKSFQRTCLSLLALMFAGVVSAQQVSKEEALQKAQAFLNKNVNNPQSTRKAPRQAPRLVLANNSSELYAFNDEANGGYVIVSGDERMPDVLAYSYDGLYDADNLPCNMKAWMEEYAAQVTYLREHPEARVAKRAATERRDIAPLLTCWFNQGTPYNNKCPAVDGKHCPTGCVATAMAQIMYYYQWPKQTANEIPGYASMSAMPITSIDWDHILNIYSWEETDSKEQIDAISTLMLLCGMSVGTNYGLDGSGAGPFITEALSMYFDYDDLLETIYPFYLNEWDETIYDELNEGRPIIYCASNEIGGHSFVLDGYENGFFHVNWGWGGSDSYVIFTSEDGWEGFDFGHSAIVGIQPEKPDTPSRYAVLDNGKMTIYYDKEKNHHSGTILPYQHEWKKYAEKITECLIDPSYANVEKRNFEGLFKGLSNLKSIEGMENLNTSKAELMLRMFEGCSNLTNLDVSGFKTDKVVSMMAMFEGCRSLKGLDVSGFKTGEVENMQGMFSDCSSLTSLDVSGFNTDNVVRLSAMFYGCSSLTSLDVSGFNTGNVIDMDMMFSGCSSLTSLDVSALKTDNATNLMWMFKDCSNLTNLDVSGFKTDNVTNMSYMFYNCSGLKSLDVSSLKTDKVTGMDKMFYGCSGLTSLDVSGMNTANATNMESMFYGCSGLTSIDVSGFKTENVWLMDEMFQGCSGLTSLDLSNFKTNHVTTMKSMFHGCHNLTSLDVSGFKTDNVTNMNSMFGYCSALTSLDLSNFKTQKVTDVEYLFEGCSKLSTIYVSERWDVSNVSTSEDMFWNCFGIVGGAGTAYDADHIGREYAHIDGGPGNPGYFTYKASKLYTITYMVDGVVYKAYDLEPGTIITTEAEPIKEGYTFSGWSEIPATMPTHDVTVTGTLSLAYKHISLKDVPFGRWNSWVANASMTEETECSWIVDEPTSTAYGDVSVISYADLSGYSKLFVKVSNGVPRMLFNRDKEEGQWNKYEEQSHLIDNTKGGWCARYFSQDGDTYIVDLSLMVKEKGFAHLHAIKSQSFDGSVTIKSMELTFNSYKLTYMIDNEVYKEVTYEYGATINPETEPTKEGYTFSGWSEIPETMPSHFVIVRGSFTINEYNLTYIIDDEVYKTLSYKYLARITPVSAPKKEGYTFSGWSEIPKTMPAEDVTVTGTFTVNKYKLTYMIDGELYLTEEVEYGAEITAPNPPARDGYDFAWSDVPETMPAHDITINGSYTTGIEDLSARKHDAKIFSLEGKLQGKMRKGINIIRYGDGSVRKVFVKVKR